MESCKKCKRRTRPTHRDPSFPISQTIIANQYKIWRKDYILLTQSWKKLWKKCRTKPGQVGIRCQTKPWTLTFWTERGMVFVKGDLKAKLYRKKCSMQAFLQNSCRRAGCKTNKTLANVLIVLGSCPRRRWPIPNLQHLWLCYGLPVKRKIKKRELTFKHISDAQFTVVKGSGAGQTSVFET